MSNLPYLVAEINAALEIYLSGRTGQQYNRTAFILCDDGTELASKLFLLTDNKDWSDKKTNAIFKRFKEVTMDVRGVFSKKRSSDLTALNSLIERIEDRRVRRNNFFHSTHLLDLNLHARDCVEAFCDLMDYGKMLFPNEWDNTVVSTGNMRTCEVLVRLDKNSWADPNVLTKVNAIIGGWPRTGLPPKKRGCEVTHYAEDMHLRLAIRNGGRELCNRLTALL